MSTTRTLEQVIGAELRRRREAAGARQEAVALTAQRFGLNWTQPTVAAIERGRRGLSLVEAACLPWIAAWTFDFRPWALGDFIPDTDEVVILAPSSQETSLRALRPQYAGLGATHEGYAGEERPAGPPPPPPGGLVTEADRKAARALQIEPEEIVAAARALWGRGLEEERNRLVDDPAASPQKRGRVTRGLVRQIQQRIRGTKTRGRRS
jgi:transcriptional regulator with XRE-family HTH domain